MKISRPSWFNSSVVQYVLLGFILLLCVFIIYSFMNQPDVGAITEKAIAIERERVADELKQTREREGELQKAIDQLNSEIGTLRKDIAESVKKREELHDAIGKARSIRDIDRILDGNKR